MQTAPDGYRRIVWMIKRMIKGHPTESDAASASSSKVVVGEASTVCRASTRPMVAVGAGSPGRRCQVCCGMGLEGRSSAAPRPMSPITANEAIASA